VTVGFLSSHTNSGSFARYDTIQNPSEALNTAYDYRRNTLSKVPKFIKEIPFGGGFGSNGPAATYPGGNGILRDAESEPTYLLIETGIPGLIVMYGFVFTLFYLSVARIRKIADRELRVLLTAVAAPLFAIFMTGFVGINSATVPGAPYLWLAGGILSYWLLGRGRVSAKRPRVRTEFGSPLVPEPSG
jgi:hypothetical protein